VLSFARVRRDPHAIRYHGDATRRLGINVDRHIIKVYALMGGLAGLAGAMSLAHYTTTTIAGHTTDNLSAIAAAVIGGTSLFGGRGGVGGSVVGVRVPAEWPTGVDRLAVHRS